MTTLALNYKDAAATVGVSVKVLQRAVAEGELLASYPNARPVFTMVELERWLLSLPHEKPL